MFNPLNTQKMIRRLSGSLRLSRPRDLVPVLLSSVLSSTSSLKISHVPWNNPRSYSRKSSPSSSSSSSFSKSTIDSSVVGVDIGTFTGTGTGIDAADTETDNIHPYTILSSKFSPEEISQARSWLDSLSSNSLPPPSSFLISYSRSSGPGGQNVNKVSTKATLKLPASLWIGGSKNNNWIPKVIKYILFSSSPSTSTSTSKSTSIINYNKFPYQTLDGSLVIQSDTHRSRSANLEDCFQKLINAIKQHVHIPKEPDQLNIRKWKDVKAKANSVRKLEKIKRSTKKEFRKQKYNNDD